MAETPRTLSWGSSEVPSIDAVISVNHQLNAGAYFTCQEFTLPSQPPLPEGVSENTLLFGVFCVTSVLIWKWERKINPKSLPVLQRIIIKNVILCWVWWEHTQKYKMENPQGAQSLSVKRKKKKKRFYFGRFLYTVLHLNKSGTFLVCSFSTPAWKENSPIRRSKNC